MTLETRSIVRAIPLWLVLTASLLLTLWSVKQLATALVKNVGGEYETTASSGMKSPEMGMGYGYNNYCLIMPMYPPLSSNMPPGSPSMTQEDKMALEKYNKEMERYNAEYSAACKAEMEKQDKLKMQSQQMGWSGAVTVYSILSLLGIFVSALSLMTIRKDEKVV